MRRAGWLQDNSNWYYLSKKGYALTGRRAIDTAKATALRKAGYAVKLAPRLSFDKVVPLLEV